MPSREENHREQIDLVLAMSIPWSRIGFSEDGLLLLKKAETLAEELSEEKRRLKIRSLLGSYYIFVGGDPQLGWTYLEDCLDHPEILQDDQVLIQVGYDLCSAWTVSGDYQRINQVAPTLISLIERGRTQAEFYGKMANPYSHLLALWGLGMGMSGEFDQGRKLCKKALSFAHEINHLNTLVMVELCYGFLFSAMGDGTKAVNHIQKAISYAEESQNLVIQGFLWAGMGAANCLMGQVQTGLDQTEKGLGMHQDLGLLFYLCNCHYHCGFAHFELGDLEEAQTHFELGLQSALQNQERYAQALIRLYLGWVIARKDPTQVEAAVEYIHQGINQSEELGLRAIYPLGYMILGAVYAESGRPKEALEHLKKAEAMFQEMGMDYWLERTRTLLAKVV
jgi:tetratricopeptide (TPR) repeat protein